MKKFLFLLLFSSLAIVHAQVYTPSGTIQGSSGNNYLGVGESSPDARVHIRERDGVALLLDVGSGGQVIGGGYAYTDYPFELRWSDAATGTNNALRARMYNNGRLDLGADFSSYGVLGNTRLAVNSSLQVFAAGNNYSRLQNNRLSWSNSGSNDFHFSFYNPSTSSDLDVVTYTAAGNTFIHGNLGVGVNPTNRVHVKNAAGNQDLLTLNDEGTLIIRNDNALNSGTTGQITGLQINTNGWRGHDYALEIVTGHGKIFDISNAGNMHIGPDLNFDVPGGYRLYVQDGIRTEKVRVDVSDENGWADYVFEEGYELMSLEDLEKFIEENGHLPGVPSGEKVAEEGIDLAEMNKILLEKVEELTLRVIELDKALEK